jgi:oxygen-dependent protoporphyrinogen oxidase
MKRVVIIGGGITGLAAAHRILERSPREPGHIELTLLEASSRLGGIVQTRERDGFLLECGPDSFISEKPEAIELARRLGLETNLVETNKNYRRSFIVRNGRLLPVPEGFHLLAPAQVWPFITSGIFSLRGKARMAMDLVLPRRPRRNVNGDSDVADESLAQFVRRRLGREALERMAQPMVGGIYTADPEKLSLRATMPRFLAMEREHRSLIRALRKQNRSPTVREGSGLSGTSGARYNLFLSFDRGMQLLTDKLTDTISNSRLISIRVNTRVESLEREPATANGPARWKVKTNHNEELPADAVCLALPAYVSGQLLRKIDVQLASELERIPYASSVTVNLAYKCEDIPHPLDGFGFVVPFIEKRAVMACTFSSVKFAGRAPEGHVLLRAFAGGDLQPELFQLDRDELVSRVRADLRDLLGILRPPIFTEVSKWERSMPQYHVGHVERFQRIQDGVASLPGVTLAGNAYTGPGIPDCIRSGEAAADELMNRFGE